MPWLYRPPSAARRFFNDFIWETTDGSALLTFDDGPTPGATDAVLDELERADVKALFFVVGDAAARAPELLREVHEAGHLVGNHTRTHANMRGLSPGEQRSEIESAARVVEETIGYAPRYFRPPYGKFDASLRRVLRDLGLIGVMWTLLPYDWRSDAELSRRVVEKYFEASVVVALHDSLKSKPIARETIRVLVETARERNCRFGDPRLCLS
ncbi:MAG: polysaccharide deacetylase family protein [Ignavibacteriales bacterium]|nr:polysaccharide deacetylase family protein [Ignavibacteriales bacterium]